MIDLTKAPEGATHYVITDILKKLQFMKNITEKSYDWYNSDGRWISGDRALYIKNCKPIVEWSIYNNTIPLSELSDEQVGAIFRYGIENGVIEVRDDNGKWWDNLSLVGWHTALAYRAKQKSERELFIDAAKKSASLRARDGAETIYGELFDAGFKAPKVGG